MDLSIGNSIKCKNYTYNIQQKLSSSCYVVTIILTGDLGTLDTNEKFLLTNNSQCIKSLQRENNNLVVEMFSLSGEQIYVLNDSATNRELILRTYGTTSQTQQFNINKYQGQTLNGIPHGTGTMIYGDGKKYTGEFRNGQRHGCGILVMPNGESFKGLFQNDTITEDGIYYDENGNFRNTKRSKGIFWGKLLWRKSWRLLASIACFTLAGLTVWLIMEFFTSGKGGIVRVGIFVAPLVVTWWGFKNLISFFINLKSSKH